MSELEPNAFLIELPVMEGKGIYLTHPLGLKATFDDGKTAEVSVAGGNLVIYFGEVTYTIGLSEILTEVLAVAVGRKTKRSIHWEPMQPEIEDPATGVTVVEWDGPVVMGENDDE